YKDYKFVTVTPHTHQMYLDRWIAPSLNLTNSSLINLFGWSIAIPEENIESELRNLLLDNDLAQTTDDLLRSKVRISNLNDDLYVHSAYPTEAENSVFFGPDTYRFARFIRQVIEAKRFDNDSAFLNSTDVCRILDIGCGTGAGGIVAAKLIPHHKVNLVLNDINPLALNYACANAAAAGFPASFVCGDALTAVEGNFDLIVCNPPYLDDASERSYRHGGERLGRAFSVRIVAESIQRLDYGGVLVLYTGVAMSGCEDPFLAEIQSILAASNLTEKKLTEKNFELFYEEIDPDIFSEELTRSVYADCHRIAAVGLVITRTQ
ncbi:MAG: methyltransferase domain-containing protein, partial [Chitinophagaceae bacterium]